MPKNIPKTRAGWLSIIVLCALSCLVAGHSANGQSQSESYALIYNGQVAAEEGPEAIAAIAEEVGLPVRFISNIAELPQLLGNAAMFIIGGTEDDLNPLFQAFTPDVTTALKNYLNNGGSYLGVCGGGFLASI